MQTIQVEVRDDHLARMARVKKPIVAVAELIWNSLDADATKVRVDFSRNELRSITGITVSDNGHGMDYDETMTYFGSLGGSWKRTTKRSKKRRRLLHGRNGKGRFRAFHLGKDVEWTSRFKKNGEVYEFRVAGSFPHLKKFKISDQKKVLGQDPGTSVRVRHPQKTFLSLTGNDATQWITEQFAFYMLQYPAISIKYDGRKIDPQEAQRAATDIRLQDVVLQGGQSVSASLTIIEWKNPTERKLYLCDEAGFALSEVPPGVQAPGMAFSAYLKTEYFREFEEEDNLEIAELHPDIKALTDAAKSHLREYYKTRASERRARLLQIWKDERVYPYRGNPKNIVEETERQVFDVCALSVYEAHPDLGGLENKGTRLTLNLLKEALETSPTALRRILEEVLDLPEDRIRELAELLRRTSLDRIISACKLVGDRLDFIAGLETLLFDSDYKKKFLERRQLHRIVADNTWLLGEEFSLSVDDRSLNEVLKQHMHMRDDPIELAVAEPVLREDGTQGIIDLMLSRRIPLPKKEERQHLIVEMKRPTVAIDQKALTQIESYAFAVAQDERFRDTATTWTYWALSSEIADTVRRKAKQRNKPQGLLYDDDEGRLTIWVKTWGEVIQDCKGRLGFYQEQLHFAASKEDALEYLRQNYAQYIPEAPNTAEISQGRKARRKKSKKKRK